MDPVRARLRSIQSAKCIRGLGEAEMRGQIRTTRERGCPRRKDG